MTTRFISTTARARDRTVTTVLPRLRPRLAQAIWNRDAPLFRARRLPLVLPPSVYRTASTGDTFAAMRPGRAQDKNTVRSENSAAPIKIQGSKETNVFL